MRTHWAMFGFIFIFLCLTGNRILSSPFEYHIYDKKDGFEQSYIYTIVQDNNNFLWIGANDGLYRFDGVTFKKYTKEHGLDENLVYCSFSDSSGSIYFGHIQGGITVLSEDKFKIIGLPGNIIPQVISFMEYENQVFALTRNHGVFLIKADSAIGFIQNEFLNRVCTGMSELEGRLYVSHNEGVSYIDIKKLLNNSRDVSEIRQLKDIAVNAIVRQKNNNKLWIATEEKGIFEMDHEMHLQMAIAPQNTVKQVGVIYEDDFGLWVGSKTNGLRKYVYDLEHGRYVMQHSLNIEAGFATSQVSCIVQDHEFNYFIGSYDKGLVYLKPLPLESFKYKDFEFNEINTVAPWKKNQFLVGTNRGLYQLKYDPLINEWCAEQDDWMKKIKITISALHINKKGIYVGSVDNGIYFIDEQKEIRELFSNKFFKNSRIKKITEDHLNNLWISVGGAGIYKINEEKKEIINYSTASGFIHNEIKDLFVDSQNRLWIGMHANGLSVLDETTQFFHLTKSGYLAARDINSIREDKFGAIWIATDGMGIYKYNNRFQLIKNFTAADQLQSNYCSFIIPDEDCMWVGYYDGIDRIDYEDEKVERYYTGAGNDFTPLNNTAAINNSSLILIPSTSGFYILNKKQKKNSKKRHQLILTGWKVNDNEVSIEDYIKNGKLSLSDNENRLSFDFLNISFEHSANILYSHRLNGKDEGVWSAPSNLRSQGFPSLSPGDYVFEVKSYPENDLSYYETISLRFKISPPFYQQIWFIGLSVFSIVAFSFVYQRQKTIRIVKQKNEFEKLVKERTQEIILQKEEIISKNEALRTAQIEVIQTNDKLVDLNEKLENLVEERTEKLKKAVKELEIFLYHASHDLKGPVARIKGLSMLAQMESNHPELQPLQLMDAESRHLDFILDKLAKIHCAISIPVEYTKIRVHELIYEVIGKFSGWNEYHQINWQLDCHQDFEVVSDKDTLMFIIENLLENSIIFQNRDPEKEKKIKISTAAKAKHFSIVIEDNGIGIPKNIKEHIFEMYFRGSICSKGNGLGLYLVQKGIQKLNGKIDFYSKPMEQTRFNLIIPNLNKTETKRKIPANPIY